MDYIQKLEKIFDKKINITTHQGLNTAIQVLKKDYLNQVSYHVNWANSIKEDLIDPIVEFYEKQTEQGRIINNDIRKIEKEFADIYMKLDTAKTSFHKSAREAERLKLQSEIFKHNNINSINDNNVKISINKYELTFQKALKEAKDIERNYIIALNTTNISREEYIDKMTKGLTKFQTLEEDYISFVKDCLRKFVVYQVALNRNLQYDIEKKASAMEGIDIRSEIVTFIETNKTNSIPPYKIEFEPYISEIMLPKKNEFNMNISTDKANLISKTVKSLVIPSMFEDDETIVQENKDVNILSESGNKMKITVSNIKKSILDIKETGEIKDNISEEKNNKKDEQNEKAKEPSVSDNINNDKKDEIKEPRKSDKNEEKKESTSTSTINTKEDKISEIYLNVKEFINSIFYSTEPEFSLDTNKSTHKGFTEVNTILEYAWEGRNLSYDEKYIFVQNTKKRINRKHFLDRLNKIRSDGMFSLDSKSYNSIAMLINIILPECASDENYDLLKQIITLSQTFYKIASEPNKPRVFIHKAIDNHNIWKSEKLWRELIRYSINEELQQQKTLSSHNNESLVDKLTRASQIALVQVTSFTYNMLNYTVIKNHIKNIVLDFSEYYGFTKDQEDELINTIKNYDYSYSSNNSFINATTSNSGKSEINDKIKDEKIENEVKVNNKPISKEDTNIN